MSAYDEFAAHIAECNDLFNALNLLKWDMRTKMPAAGAGTRAAQVATLTRLAKERFASDKTERLLDAAERQLARQPDDSYPARALRQTRRQLEAQRRIPAALTGRLAAAAAESEMVWEGARARDDFAAFKPYLARMLSLKIELAEAIGYDDHPFDALVGQFEPGMTAARLTLLFGELKQGILPLLGRIAENDRPLGIDLWRAEYDIEKQRRLCLELAEIIGFDFQRGRLDSTVHPFEISITREDVRLTTRYDRHYLPMSLFATLHETGHGLYEQNVSPELTRSALTCDFLRQSGGGGTSSGAHEFSSRLWENQIGRSRAFWQLHFGRLRSIFPRQLAQADAELFYRAVNRVRPSLNRVEADEVSYNLHIMLRTEIEMGLLDGALAVDDLPQIWNARMQDYLGLSPPNDREGLLQDVHWSAGYFGSFPCYTLGNIMAAQVMAAAREQLPDLDDRLAAGDYRSLLAWLEERIYRHGRAYSAGELLRQVTGDELNVQPLLRYLEAKYSDLYGLSA